MFQLTFLPLTFFLTLTPIMWAQEKYPIQLHRPAQAGQTYTYAAVGRLFEEINITIDGNTSEIKQANYRCELASKVEVITVDDLGLPTQLLLTVYRFQKQRQDDELAIDLLGRGSEVLCSYSPDGATFTINTEPVNDDVAEALSVVAMKLSSQFGETEDQVMGTNDPKAEGETWTLNNQSIAAALARNGFHITPDNLRSESVLASVSKLEGGQPSFLAVNTTIVGEGISPELPQGYTTKSGTLTNTLNRRLPTDPSLPIAGEEVDFEIIAESEGKEAESIVNLKIHLKQTLKARYTRIGA